MTIRQTYLSKYTVRLPTIIDRDRHNSYKDVMAERSAIKYDAYFQCFATNQQVALWKEAWGEI